MAVTSQQALDELIDTLIHNNAEAVADEIKRVIGRGITEEISVKNRMNELSQRPLKPEEAYNVAVEILVASVEAVVMKKHALQELQAVMGTKAAMAWHQDYVEKSPVKTESYDSISISDVNDTDNFEKILLALVKKMGSA